MLQQENILISAGLSEEQALVYQTLIEKGPMRASSLSQWLGIKRGLVYKVLEQLEAMGLVSKKGGAGTVATFAPEHPSRLMELVEQKAKSLALTKETLSYSLGTLASQFNLQSGKPNVQFYEGEEGIINVYERILKSGTKQIYSFEDGGEMAAFIPEYIPEFIKKRINLKIKNKVIAPSLNVVNVNSEKELRETKFVSASLFPFSMDVKITEELVSIITFQKNSPVGILIENKEIAENFKKLFDLVWSLEKENTNTVE